MKRRLSTPFFWLAAFILTVGLACSLGGSTPSAPTAPPAPTQLTLPTQPPAPTQPPQPGDTPSAPQPPSGAVSTLQDVKSATIQLEAQGTFVDPQVGLLVNAAGRGSGFIIDPSGIAVTNNHVVTGAALLKVWVGGETTPRNAKILGVSECSDLAVIDIDGDGFPYLDWFSGSIDVGQDMYIAGFPLGNPEYTLTRGVVSKAQAGGETNWASVPTVLEYDATSNPGNSGGPVVDPNGKVLAVHYAGSSSTRQAFGIARDAALAVIGQLRGGQDVNSIGINGTAVRSDDGSLSGIWVSSVKSGSPADKAGIRGGDIVYTLEGLVLATDGSMKDYCDVLRTHNSTDTLSLEVIRFATLEILGGQLNGRTLEVVGNFGTGGGDNGDNGSTGDGEAPDFFTEEFDGSIDNWSYFLTSGNESQMNLRTNNGKLAFELNGKDLWVYLTYDPYTYTDVVIDAAAENLGRNNNNVSLICRYSDRGWYEFNIANNGLYSILAYNSLNKTYDLMVNGGSTAIKSGFNTNVYTAVCQGNTLTLYINNTLVKSYTDTKHNYPEGQIGISVASFDTLPIDVEFEYVTIAQP